MSYLNLRPQGGFLGPALVIGLISILGATWQGVLNHFLDFLLLIGTFFVPVFAIMLADYYVLRRGEYSVRDILERGGGRYWFMGGFNVPAWAAYIVGAGLALYWTRISPPLLRCDRPRLCPDFRPLPDPPLRRGPREEEGRRNRPGAGLGPCPRG